VVAVEWSPPPSSRVVALVCPPLFEDVCNGEQLQQVKTTQHSAKPRKPKSRKEADQWRKDRKR